MSETTLTDCTAAHSITFARAESAESLLTQAKGALRYAMSTNHPSTLRTCLCVKCEDARSVLAAIGEG